MAFEVKPVKEYDGARYPPPESRWVVILKATVISAVFAVACGLSFHRDARWLRPLEILRKAVGEAADSRPAGGRLESPDGPDVLLGVMVPLPPADLTPPARTRR
jgi:hypothetical protein